MCYNRLMETKDKIDLLVKRAELIYKKILVFLAIAGGSWIYGVKDEHVLPVFLLLILIVFSLSSFGVVLNLLKYGAIQKLLEEMDNE